MVRASYSQAEQVGSNLSCAFKQDIFITLVSPVDRDVNVGPHWPKLTEISDVKRNVYIYILH